MHTIKESQNNQGLNYLNSKSKLNINQYEYIILNYVYKILHLILQ